MRLGLTSVRRLPPSLFAALAAVLALFSPAAMAGEIEGELMNTPTDGLGQIYLVSADVVAPDTIEALTFRKSSFVSNYSDYLFNCAAKTYVALAGKRTEGNGLKSDKTLVLQAALDKLVEPYKMLPLVNKGLDALTYEIARHTCNNVLSIDIALE